MSALGLASRTLHTLQSKVVEIGRSPTSHASSTTHAHGLVYPLFRRNFELWLYGKGAGAHSSSAQTKFGSFDTLALCKPYKLVILADWLDLVKFNVFPAEGVCVPMHVRDRHTCRSLPTLQA